jgi:SseB protein C-terminal domain
MDDDIINFKPVAPAAHQFDVPALRFIGEQDGPPERELKMQLIQYFQTDQHIDAAYLAKVSYGNETSLHVALCLRIQSNAERPEICQRISSIFAAMFGPHEHLDILFLSKSQETRLTKLCPFFFIAAHYQA